MITEAGSGWLGDPNFAPVAGWQNDNPLQMAVRETTPGEPTMVTVSNPSGETVDTVLRVFPGADLAVMPLGDRAADARKNRNIASQDGSSGQVGPELEWSLKLAPGETVEIPVLAASHIAEGTAGEAFLLLTLAVSGTPPRMYWQQYE